MLSSKDLDIITGLMAAMTAYDVRSVQCEDISIERFEVIDDEEEDDPDPEKEPIWPRIVGE